MPRHADKEKFPGLNIPARNRLDLEAHIDRRSKALSILVHLFPMALIAGQKIFAENLDKIELGDVSSALAATLLFGASGFLIGRKSEVKQGIGIAASVVGTYLSPGNLPLDKTFGEILTYLPYLSYLSMLGLSAFAFRDPIVTDEN